MGELCTVACRWGDHADDSISTLHPGLEIIVCELCTVACRWGDHADDSISTLHPGLEIIEGER
ncbi:hypothetical protein L210DRAFT_2590205 [Boletus edulis BED1]|uniref:Uncharacterized protein n=1 Tax=Boletus edulis BED1 TaxID=1328754 RepID=A0AAD4BBI3_BOLED|nr:hypothetical protein L210DRAFT_2590205 [Boletus edulis BED1]